MRKFLDILESAPTEDAERCAAFTALAQAQRGAPEAAMLRVQHQIGGGVLSVLVEHIGDLTHRMCEFPDRAYYSCGYETVKSKVTKGLSYLRNEYGFAKEHDGNMQSNARYRGVELGDFLAEARIVLRAYAAEHRKLRVYNACQALGRDAAIALGEQNWSAAERCLSLLNEYLRTPETFAKYASRYEPGYCDYATGAPGRYGKVMERVEMVSTGRGRDIKVWRNPSEAEIGAALRNSQDRILRGLVISDVVLVWDGYDASHAAVLGALSDEPYHDQGFLLSRDPDAVCNEWPEGTVYELGRTTDFYIVTAGEHFPPSLGTPRRIGSVGIKDNGQTGFVPDQSN